METNCAPLLLACFYFAMREVSLTGKRDDMTDAFNSTSKYLDDLLFYYVVFVRRGCLFLLVLGIGCVILLCHSLDLPYNYSIDHT